MKILSLAMAFAFFCGVTGRAAPGDRIDPRDLKDKVSITPGTQGWIEFKQQGSVLSEPKLTKEAAEGKPGLSYEFGKESQFLMLTVKNPFPKALHYRAAARMKGRRDYVETSIITIMAGLFGTESWGDPIEELVLFDFKLTDDKL